MQTKTMRGVCVALASARYLISLLLLWLGLAMPVWANDAAAPPTTQAGQSATLLPDGKWLMVGGQGSNGRPTADVYILDGTKHAPLGTGLLQPRRSHTTTLLPDGSVLILGGLDAASAVLSTAEQLDPTSGTLIPLGELGLIARAGHSATVLADGSLLIIGGHDQRGHPVYEAEIYQPQTKQAERFSPKLNMARMEHLAALLPNADVLLWQGVNQEREALHDGEVYDAARQEFNAVNAGAVGALRQALVPIGPPSVQASRPAAGAGAVPVDKPLMVHFTQRMAVATLNERSVTLIGPGGVVPIKAVPVEHGLLLFVTPARDLMPASHYTLFIKGAANELGQPLALSAIGFETAQLGRENIAASDKAAVVDAWLPDASHFSGDWRIRRENSPLQSLPALKADNGESALSGQVLTLDGQALPNTSLTIGTRTTLSDNSGRFLLTGLAAGTQVLAIDGPAGARYGSYQVRVDIKSQQTNALGYTIWMSRLDPAGDMSLPSPTVRDMVLSTPRIPGLELHIPAGTVIRDRKGKIVTTINMTAIPTDRPPFPIPALGVPVYFTIQPGGATLSSIAGQMQGAQLIYPNFGGSAPGTRIDFWNYDVQTKGWYVYGQGTVAPNGRQIIPDKGVAIYEFTGAMVASPFNAPREGPPPGGCDPGACNADPAQPAPPNGCAGDPVDCATGLFIQRNTDMVVRDILPIVLGRTYRPRDPDSRAFGIGSNLSYDFFLVGDTWPYTYQELILPDGGRVRYTRTSPGREYMGAVYKHTSSASKFFGSTIRWVLGYWNLLLKDGTKLIFPEAEYGRARGAAVVGIIDRSGNALTLVRNNQSNLTRISSPSGRYVDFTYDSKQRITQASDNMGRAVTYEYDAAGRLTKMRDSGGQSESYTYDERHNMLTVQDRRGNLMVRNAYDANNRVIEQTYADGSANQFVYALDTAGKVSSTFVTNERGMVRRMQFNAQGYLTTLVHADGLPEQQTTTFERDPLTNLMLSIIDPLGRKTSYTYDDKGNMQTQTVLAGTAEAATMKTSYTSDFNQLASVSDFLGRQTLLRYDLRGNLIEVQDANGNTSKRSYNNASQLIQLSDALGHTTTFGYNSSYDLQSLTDALNRSTQLFSDGAGQVRSITDALGRQSFLDYDEQGRPQRSTDPAGQSIANSYDANGNLIEVSDPKGSRYRFDYDVRNALASSTDPLGRTESYAYDAKHNLVEKTDRKGQTTRYAYDALDRLVTTRYADGSTVSRRYDQGNRLIRIDDSANGTLSFAYDSRDRLTEALTPKGKVSYTYDANGRRSSMSVPGLPLLRYSYDAGGRLTAIEQAPGPANNDTAQRISFAYDAADHRTQTTYANGVTRQDEYDAAGQLTAIVYRQADGSRLGELLYSYDEGGQRRQVGGSLARSALPEAVPAATVDAANQLATWGEQTLTYDANGNLSDDGQQLYVWNARDQLEQIRSKEGAVLASFSYDALGRRQTKTVNGIATGYVYDGLNIVQELAGANSDNANAANVRASYLSGGIDEVFAQLSGAGPAAKVRTYLRDALGSTLRLVDSAGNKVVDYTYDPYGNTTADAAVSNPFQYTGRENDGTGLYYYRARYYVPKWGRFISSDPIGLAGGINGHVYVRNNPLSWTDPKGLDATNWNNTQGGRSRLNGPTNGNWGGLCWSGGQYSCEGHASGDAPPTDSADQCYQRHDRCKDSCASGAGQQRCQSACNRALVNDLRGLPDDSRQWTHPPRPGTEVDSQNFRDYAIWYFK